MLKIRPKAMFVFPVIHKTSTEHSLHLLSLSGKLKTAFFLKKFMPFMHQGSHCTDQGLKNLSHFYNPITKKGLHGARHALDEFQLTYKQMQKAYQCNNIPRYFHCLGILLHLIQDLCVPHHVFGCLLQGHHTYEAWANEHHHDYVAQEPLFINCQDPIALLNRNAHISMGYEELLCQPSENQMHEATATLLPLAQQTSALFLSTLEEQIFVLHQIYETRTNHAYPVLKQA